MGKLQFVLNKLDGRPLLDTLRGHLSDYNKRENKDDRDAQKLKKLINLEFEEVIRRLSSPDQTLREGVENCLSMDLKGDDKDALDQINEGIKTRYQRMYNQLLEATHTFSKKVAEDFCEKQSAGVATSERFHYHNDLPADEDALLKELKEGTAHERYLDENRKKLVNTPPPDYPIYHSTFQVIGLSKINQSLLFRNEPLAETALWQLYRAKTINTIDQIDKLAAPFNYLDEQGEKKTSSILDEMMKESSPALRAFFDVINSICDTLGLDIKFNKSKVQEFRDSFHKITKNVETENPLEGDLIFKPKL